MFKKESYTLLIVVTVFFQVYLHSAEPVEPTPEDFALKIVPAEIELEAALDVLTSVDLEVVLSSKVGGVQGWSFGVMAKNNGLEQFYIENAWEHPDLSEIAGEEFTTGTLVSGRPSFHHINYYTKNDFASQGAMAEVPNEMMNLGEVENDSIDGVEGKWTAITDGVVIDFGALIVLPASEEFGVLSIRAQIQGDAEWPNTGTLVFKDNIGQPPVETMVVWNNQSMKKGDKGDDLHIPPEIQAPSTISLTISSASNFIRGDANGDNSYNLADAVTILNYLFGSGEPSECLKSNDANDDGKINLADAVRMLDYLYGGAEVLDAPFETCSTDPTPDNLTCENFSVCE